MYTVPSSEAEMMLYLSAESDKLTILPRWTKYSIYSHWYSDY